MDWADAYARLTAALDTDEIDDVIDTATAALFAGSPADEGVPFLVAAVQSARSDLTLRSAALALALIAPASHLDAVTSLLSAYARKSEDAFLAPALMGALGLLAARCPLARAELSSLLLRLDASGPRYLLIRGAQLIGRLDAVRSEPNLRTKLGAIGSSPDLAVQGEVRQQLALIALSDALLSDDRSTFRENLTGVRAAFRRAEQSGEQREDATTLVVLLDMLIAFLELSRDRNATITRLHALGNDAQESLVALRTLGQSYRSDREAAHIQRVLDIANVLSRSAEGSTPGRSS